MKKLNTKGFSHLEILLIIVVVALVSGSGYYYFKNQKKHNTQTTNTTAQTPAPTPAKQSAELKEYKNTEYGFSFKYPGDWAISENMHDIGRGGNEGEVVVTSPNGTKVHFGPNFGGKGGDCWDDQANARTTRTCDTLTVYRAEKLDFNPAGNPVYFYQASITAPTRIDGKTVYLVFISNNDFFPTSPGSVMGAILHPYDEIHLDKGEVTILVEGKDDAKKDSKAYFDTNEVKEAAPVLKSFRAF